MSKENLIKINLINFSKTTSILNMYRFERLCLYSVKHYAYLFSHIYITLEISYPEGDTCSLTVKYVRYLKAQGLKYLRGDNKLRCRKI